MDNKQEGSYFDGGFWELAGWTLLGFLVCLFTLGIAFPWVYCWIVSWRTNHTVVDGKRLQFNGKGASLLGHFILQGWLLGLILTPLTLGLYPLYYFNVSLKKWEIKNTNFFNINITGNNNSSGNDNIKWKCPKCNNSNPNSTYQCEKCGYKLI